MKDLTFTTLIAVFEEIFGRGLFLGHGGRRSSDHRRLSIRACP
jgi:hypothetical protein